MTNQIAAMLFPLVTLAVVGLVALVVRKPWKQRAVVTVRKHPWPGQVIVGETEFAFPDEPPAATGARDLTPEQMEVILEGLGGPEDRVLSPQARRQLHEELALDLAQADKILQRIRARESRLRNIDELVQTSNGGNF